MSGTISPTMITVRQGDSFIIDVNVKKCCDDMDLTDFTAEMQVRREGGDLLFSVTSTEVDVANGKIALILTPNMTNIEVGDYVCDIQIYNSDKSIVNTIYPQDVNKVATFRVTQQITK